MSELPLSYDAWEKLAEAYSERVETKAHNALYERPATLSLLPEIKGKRILDAGCGPGVYAQILHRQGAEVVAFDRSPKMVELARERTGDKAEIFHADFRDPLDFARDSEFDVVLSTLALDFVSNWRPVFIEFFRVLKRDSILVFSAGHPLSDYYRFRGIANYFETEPLSETWSGFGFEIEVPFYRRPLSEMINPLIETGFLLDRILEPIPLAEFHEVEPDDYEKLIREPGFICIRAKKQAAS